MSNRALFWMTGLVILCIIVLLLINFAPAIWTLNAEKYLKFNDVRGMAVEHNQKLYTLNFDQQTKLIGYFNQSIPVKNTIIANAKPKLEISKIIVYRFDLPDLTIIPIDYMDNNLVYSAPDWNPGGLMKDTSLGAVKNILSQSFDP